MALTGNPIKDIYQRFLNLPNTITTSYQRVKDGLGANTGLELATNKVRVDALEFGSNPALLSSGTQPALILDGLEVKRRTIYPFGFSEKDPFDAYFEFTDTSAAYTANDGVPTLVVNNLSATQIKEASDFTLADAYDTTNHIWLPPITDNKDVFKIVLEINAAPTSGWTIGDYVEIGLEYDGSGAITNGTKYYTMHKGAGFAHQLTYEHTFVLNQDIKTNGFRIFVKPIGGDVDIDGCKATLIRLIKA